MAKLYGILEYALVQLADTGYINILTFIRTIYEELSSFLELLLSITIFKSSPEIATTYSEAISLLISLSAIYLILEVTLIGKRVIKLVLLLGWSLLMLSILMSFYMV